MNNFASSWNKVSGIFDTGGQKKKIDTRAADNMLLAWPVLLDLISRHFGNKENLKALDFGCGTGAFCQKLYDLKFSVTGTDIAREMIERARKNTDKTINYFVGDSQILKKLPQFDLIASIMVLQFIQSISQALVDIDQALKPGGLLVFASFNPEWVGECLKRKFRFGDGYIDFNGVKIPIYIRTVKEYNQLMSQYKYKKILESYPPFTAEFLSKYPGKYPVNVSKFMILGYAKK